MGLYVEFFCLILLTLAHMGIVGCFVWFIGEIHNQNRDWKADILLGWDNAYMGEDAPFLREFGNDRKHLHPFHLPCNNPPTRDPIHGKEALKVGEERYRNWLIIRKEKFGV